MNNRQKEKMEAEFILLRDQVNQVGSKYLKEVDIEEVTIRFWQEMYDDKNILREVHEKYPVDKGHQKL